jgi:Ca-activated chloride channel homolog
MRALLLAMALLPALAAPAAGQGWIEPLPGRPGWEVVKVRSAVSVRVEGRVAQVEVEEWFRNPGRGLGEGDYLHPLPGEAVFSGFSLFQGEEELVGEMMDAERARQIYEEIVRSKRDPALIELAGHGLVRARIFPIGPGETRKVTLRFTQLLERSGDALVFRYAGSRPRAGAAAPESPATFELVAEGAEGFAEPFSPTHALRAARERGRLVVRPQGEIGSELVCFLPLARSVVGLALATHRPHPGEDGYFMLTLSPGEVRGESPPRDVVAVVDVSGSMAGAKLRQAQAALRQLLGSLGADDRFRLVAFSSRVSVHHEGWAPASAEALREAEAWTDALRAEGGTNIEDALAEAFRLGSPEARLPIVVFLTDGAPTVGTTDPERLAERAEAARGRARVFAFGVGHDVNTYLLDRLARAGRGATHYVAPGEDVEAAVGALAAKIRHPVLTDLVLEAPLRVTEIHPELLPDLFAGDELVIFGRYAPGSGSGRAGGVLALTGRRAGRPERFTLDAAFPREARGHDYIPRLWAARKVGALEERLRLGDRDPELVEEIRRTALRYGVLSELTAYLVQEPEGTPWQPRPGGFVPQGSPLAMAPSQATGERAFAAAREAAARREVRTAVGLDALDAAHAGAAADRRTVAGRIFLLREEVWTDALHRSELPLVTIEPFSPAYFALVAQLPEIRPYLAAFEHVLVAGQGASVRVAPGGERDAASVAQLVRGFRRP